MDIVQGEDRTFRLKFRAIDEHGATRVYDISSASEITVLMPGRTERLVLTLSDDDIDNDDGDQGFCDVTLTNEDTQSLRVGDGQLFEVIVDFGTERRIYQPEVVFNVKKRRVS